MSNANQEDARTQLRDLPADAGAAVPQRECLTDLSEDELRLVHGGERLVTWVSSTYSGGTCGGPNGYGGGSDLDAI
jgi:hypothetical protein